MCSKLNIQQEPYTRIDEVETLTSKFKPARTQEFNKGIRRAIYPEVQHNHKGLPTSPLSRSHKGLGLFHPTSTSQMTRRGRA